MCAHVGFEVIRSGELSLTDLALEWPDARVLAAVSSELVRSGESLSTPLVVADVWLFTSVLPDVHLEVRQLEIALGAAGVETHKWFSLLLCLGRSHLWWLTSDHLSVLLVPHLWNDESWVSRHGHLDGSSAFIHVSIGRDASRGVCDELKRKSNVLLLLALWRWWPLWNCSKMMVVGVGEGKHWISRSSSHDHVLGHWGHRVVLQWYSGVDRNPDTRYWSSSRRGKVRKLSVLMLVGLVSGRVDHVLGSWLWLHAEGLLDLRGVRGRVVWTQLVIGHGWTGVHRVVRRWGEFLVLQVARFGDADEIGATVVHESSVW